MAGRWAHPRPAPGGSDESRNAGFGLVSTTAAVGVFLLSLLFSVQLVVHLHTRSTLAAVGYDATRAVASRHVDHGDSNQVAMAQQAAEFRARSLLGGLGGDARFVWITDEGVVRLHLTVTRPGIVPSSLSPFGGPQRISRTFVLRIEQQQ